jgi:hypothetical protein
MTAGTGMPPHLIEYWTHGPGGREIQWGSSGDYDRCIVSIQAKVSEHGTPLGDRVIHGLCATLHKMATGARPGHAPSEGGH